MQRYNIALLPEKVGIQECFARYAQHHFKRNADEYLLSETAFMHVSLCQFLATSHEVAISVYTKFKERDPLDIVLTHMHVRTVRWKEHERKWIELLAHPDQRLLDLQKLCSDTVVESGLEPFTKPTAYIPHVSLARINGEALPLPATDELPLQESITCRPFLGRITERGLYIETLAK